MKKLIFRKLNIDIGVFFLISIICLTTIVWIIQAVNYLDLISEDGHGLKVYFSFTLFNLPKIISKILPFIFALSLFYTLLRYELNNELVIYWMNGVTKKKLAHLILQISFLYFLLQITLTTTVVPESLDKGRSYFRSSNVDMFSSVLKQKKFIDSVENLTIFVEKKEGNNLYKIIIKEKVDEYDSQIIIAQKGKIFSQKNKNKIVLINGKIIDNKKNNQNIVDFSEFNLDLSKYSSNTISHPKIQEMNSLDLIQCINKLREFKNVNKKIDFFLGCSNEIDNSIIEEFLKRFFGPIFIILIGLSSSLILIFNKDQKNYRLKSSLVFLISVFIIIISEISLRYSSSNISNIYIYTLIPFLLFIFIYSFLNFKFKKN
ncbi:LptF/LptG family permease [Candidatus Pelagibacter sp.]|uniref:LptF/LptG family permease n=1 Tax=Candidatus Pelagibacter sp. TaxID=2024849 RepID=UPI003F85AA04